MENYKYRFTIAIPCYNSEKTIRETLESVRCQDFKDFEVLICNDRSTDNTVKIAEEYKSYFNLRITDTGRNVLHCASSARNIGIDNAEGEWIVFLDSDDRLMDGALSGMDEKIKENEDAVFFKGYYYTFIKGKLMDKENNECMFHGKAFKTSFLRKYNLRNNQYITLYEDILFMKEMYAIIEHDSLKIIESYDTVTHIYYLGENGIPNNCTDWNGAYKSQIIGRYLVRENILNRFPDWKDKYKNEVIQGLYEGYFIYELFKYWKTSDFRQFTSVIMYQTKRYIDFIMNLYDVKDEDKYVFLNSPLTFYKTRNLIIDYIMAGYYMYPFIENDTFWTFLDEALSVSVKYSIVIPSYNPENTIGNLLDSIKRQKKANYEVVIADDRSTDDFMSVVDKYRYEMPITYCCTKDGEPKGPANARNTGLKNAKGEWVVFVDSDDILTDNALETFEKCTEQTDTMIWGGFSAGEATYYSSFIALHGKCFNRKFLIDNNIEFNTNLYTEEDYNFVNKVVSHVYGLNTIYYKICEPCYIHNMDNGESMTHKIKENYWERTFKDFVVGYSEPYLEAMDKFPEKKDLWIDWCYSIFAYSYNRMQYFLNRHNEDEPIMKELMENFKWLYNKMCGKYGLNKEYFIERSKNKKEMDDYRYGTKASVGDFEIIKSVDEMLR